MRTKRQGHMDQTERAKQFMAFSPLKGLDQCIRAAEEEPEERRELLEDEAEELNRILMSMKEGNRVKIKYYDRSRYVTETGVITRIDTAAGFIKIGSSAIPIDDIYSARLCAQED